MHDIPVEDYKSELLSQYETALRKFNKTGEDKEEVQRLKFEYQRIENENPVKTLKTEAKESIKASIKFFEEFLERNKDDVELSEEARKTLELFYDIKRGN